MDRLSAVKSIIARPTSSVSRPKVTETVSESGAFRRRLRMVRCTSQPKAKSSSITRGMLMKGSRPIRHSHKVA